MNLTLRATRKLESKIKNKINERISFNVVFSAYDNTSIVDKLSSTEQSMHEDVETVLRLTNIRYNIRRQIQQLNEESGINQMISDRKRTIELLAVWEEVKSVSESSHEPTSIDIIEGKLQAIRDGVNANTYSARDHVTVHLVNDDFLRRAEKSIQQLERDVEQMDDSILAMNMRTKVSISDIDETLLRSYGLV